MACSTAEQSSFILSSNVVLFYYMLSCICEKGSELVSSVQQQDRWCNLSFLVLWLFLDSHCWWQLLYLRSILLSPSAGTRHVHVCSRWSLTAAHCIKTHKRCQSPHDIESEIFISQLKLIFLTCLSTYCLIRCSLVGFTQLGDHCKQCCLKSQWSMMEISLNWLLNYQITKSPPIFKHFFFFNSINVQRRMEKLCQISSF